MANGGSTEVNIEAVILGQLALAVGEIRETAAEVEEQGVGVNTRFATEIELDPVAGPEVYELGKTGETGKLDQILSREVARQSGRRELVDMNGAIRGANDADTIQTQCLRAGFYDTTTRDSVTPG